MRHFKIFSVVLASFLSLGSMTAYAQSHYATKQAQESYDNAIKLERQAEEKGDKSYLERAEKEYRVAVNAEPNMVQAYIRLGYVLYALGKSEEGVKVMQEALTRHSDNMEIKHYLGLNLYQAKRSDEAADVLREVVASGKALPEAYYVLGKISLDKGEPSRAQQYFEQYAAATPDDAHAYRALAAAYIQARDIPGAESALAKLLELAPDDVVAKINMGHVKYEKGQIDEAVKLYEQAYKADPKHEELLYTIASVYYLSGRYEEAIKRFEAVLDKDPTHMGAQYFTADSELKLGHLDRAEELFKALEKEMPDYRYIRLKLAYIRMQRGESGALEDVQQLMKETTNPDDLHFGAVMLRKNGLVNDSLDIHVRLHEDHLDDSIYGVYLAREYLEMKSYNQASEILTTIIDNSPNNALAWEMLSLTLLYQGMEAMMTNEFEQARNYFDKALSMDVHVTQAHCSFAQLSLLEGNPDEAYQSFQQAVELSEDDPTVIRLAAQFDILDGDYRHALDRLNALVETQTDKALGGSGWYLMAIAHSYLGDWDAASHALTEAEKLGVTDSPARAIITLQSAMTAYNAGKYDTMDRLLQSIVKDRDSLDDVDRIRFDYMVSVNAIRSKRYSLARTSLESLRSRYASLSSVQKQEIVADGNLDISFELAYVYYETGNLDAALNSLGNRSTPEAKNLEAAIRRKLGYQALKNKKYDMALENYNRLNSLGATSVSDQYNLVVIQLEMKKLKNAGETLEKYAKQDIPEAVLNYAIFLDDADRGAEAMQYYKQYMEMTSGRKTEEIRRMLLTKMRVWGE